MAAISRSSAVPAHVEMPHTERSEGPSLWDANDPTETGISDAELTALALADEEVVLSDDAVPIVLDGGYYATMLSAWYMPPASTRSVAGWRKPVVLGIVATLIVLEALGLCSIFGQVVIG